MDKINTLNGKLIIALSRSLQIIHSKSEKLFLEHQLTMSQFAVLEALYHKGDMTIKALIESVLSTSGNMTVVIKNLEKQQLIARHDNPNDKRSFMISLTHKGKAKIEPIFEQHMLYVKDSLIDLSEEEKLVIINTLKKIERR